MRKNSARVRLFKLQKKSSGGQVALVALLVMVVLLFVSLAVISRSITDIRISEEAEESARAFSAAEAGIEEMLKKESLAVGTTSVSVGDLTADVTVSEISSFETEIERNETAQVDLEGFSGTGLEIDWSNAALELILIYDANGAGDYKVARWALKPTGSCPDVSGFTEVSSMPYSIDFSATGYSFPPALPKLLRVRPICNDAKVKVESSDSSSHPLPLQSYTIHSEVIGPSGETRAVEVTKSKPALPPIFDYTLFSGGSLIKTP